MTATGRRIEKEPNQPRPLLPSRLSRFALRTAAAWIVCSLLSGCWDRLEIEERAMVLGIGIDTEAHEISGQDENITHVGEAFPKPKTDPIRLTAQIAVPGRIPLGPSDAGGGSQPGQKPIWVLEVVGHTMDDAIMNLQQKMADRLFWGHLRVIVISKELAKQGLTNINEYLRRNTEVRRTTWIVISEGKASDLMGLTPQLERLPPLYLLNTMEHAVQMGKLPNIFAGRFWSAGSSKGTDPFLPYIKLLEAENIEIAGLAYFRTDKLVGTTEPLEIAGFMGIKGLSPGGYGVVVHIPDSETTVMYQATHRKSRTKVEIREGKPVMKLRIHTEGNLSEKSSEQVQLDAHIIEQIERQINENGVKEYRNLIRKTQQRGSDIFGFGEYVRAKRPGYWAREVRTKERWEELYRTLEIELEVSNSIRRVGSKTT
ncbi:Ger(x)C family spore germination protein [Paenibacillus sp. GCM10012303]|uniref:Ger(x)C family spore germination protein n=1 Tax=Paenibacillus sp. GCM10012303 TaxID=3317340 RepID=UPI00360CB73A